MKSHSSWNLTMMVPLLVAVTFPAGAQVKDAFTKLGKGLTKEIAAVKQPIAESIAYVGSSQCSNVKKLIGVSYEQLDNVSEPNLNELALNFRSRDLKVIYNLSSAARLLPEARGYDPRAPLIIYIHGFTDNPMGNNFGNISEAFLKTEECNILGLDASTLIRWLYLRSTTYVQFIGERLGEVLAAMVHKGLDPRSIHLIGHSLGSHIAGFTGKQFKMNVGRAVGRISGLDPAGPCFSHVDPEYRLKSTDADFVDVIHTDAGVYGLDDVVGHVDFYPNSGSEQPGCLLQSCSHSRVNELYAESVLAPDAFPAVRCKDWEAFKRNQCDNASISVMGYGCPSSARGRYFLRTADAAPFGLRAAGLRHGNDDAVVKNVFSSILG